jgi:hypothetical protein
VAFNIDDLDAEDPFEIDDGNRPHLYSHLPRPGGRYVAVGVEDIYDVYLFGNAIFYPVSGPADWKMVGEVPGVILAVPLAPPNAPDPTKCRPIGLFEASVGEQRDYLYGGNQL